MTTNNDINYNPAQIDELEFPMCVRHRHGMYISSLKQMVTEIVDNSTDEHFAGYGNIIAVAIIDDKKYVVQDMGRGMPVLPSQKDPSMSQAERAFTVLHAGGKFGLDDKGYGAKTGGLNGVGGSCVQALSDNMKVTIKTGGKIYEIKFSKGFITEKMKIVGECDVNDTGTTVEFVPDNTIWKNEVLDKKDLINRLEQICYLNPNLSIFYTDIKDNEAAVEKNISHPDGIVEYLRDLNKKNEEIISPIVVQKSIEDIDIYVGCNYTNSYSHNVYTFCNNMETISHGSHLTGFYSGIKSAINEYCDVNKIDLNVKTEDLKEGMNAIVFVRVADPNFKGQAKTELEMIEVKRVVDKAVHDDIFAYLDSNPDIAKTLIEKIKLTKKAAEAAKKAREAARNKGKSALDGVKTKLADCSSKNPDECEIYIVEGDSAGGSAKQARDRKFQAILPIFGKILNCFGEDLKKILQNVKIKQLIKALGCNIGENYCYEDLKYHKIIIFSDADVDGYHIAVLWITFFFLFYRDLIEKGHLYVACPPLFKLSYNRKIEGLSYEDRKSVIYAYNQTELEQYTDEYGDPDNIQRYKGLGEMNPDQLWGTTMNPETRKMINITIDDAKIAYDTISLLMSDIVEPRRNFIMENY